jgi:hypothetical protein
MPPSMTLAPTVRLLPHFDPYTIAVARHSDALLPAAYKGQVYRPQGWISPVVLVDGRIAGVWERSGVVTITLDLFEPKSQAMLHGFEAEANRLSAFLNKNIEVKLL